MKRLSAIIVIAFCLFPNTSQGAELAGEEAAPKKLKGAEKVIKVLKMVGMDNSAVKQTAYFIDERMDGEQFRIGSMEGQGFKMQLQYEARSVEVENFKLKLTHETMPSWQITGSSEGMMLNYHIEW